MTITNRIAKIILKDTNIKLTNSKSEQTIELNGFIKAQDKFDDFKVNEKYNYNKKSFDVRGTINLTNSKIEVSKLNSMIRPQAKSDPE